MKRILAAFMLVLFAGCASFNSYERGRSAEKVKDWDQAVLDYNKALEIDPDNMRYQMDLQRAKLEASRIHFEKGKTLRTAAQSAAGDEQLRLNQLAATELEMTVKLDPTNQFAAVELAKAVTAIQDAQRAASQHMSIDELKKRAEADNITKAQPPMLNPASNQPISLSFPHDTPIKDILRALGNAFGINVLFDQALKDDRLSIELKDVTAQQALDRVMQAGNDFYKVLDPHSIIVVPDNPQSRRDYEDLVIRTFYLSNGDAEQVTNVVRTMIEARNVFPLKALNAITIRDTADKVKIAEKIIEANDKAKAEVVVDVELLQIDLDKARDIGFVVNGWSSTAPGIVQPLTGATDTSGGTIPLTSGTLSQLRALNSGLLSFSIPNASYAALKSIGDTKLLANPELRISEGEKATLHIGQRIPVPVSTFTSVSTTTAGTFAPVTSYQYQDVGIKVSIEPRVHHNREVTLKLTVEVSNLGAPAAGTGTNGVPAQPTFATRTIESTIRLKDGETNFLAGLIQQNDEESDNKTPILGDIPIIGRLFTLNHHHETRTDLILTMTPHIIRIPDITEDDLAPMWVGTQSNLSFRGLSPRIESQSSVDPFAPAPSRQFAAEQSVAAPLAPVVVPQGSAPGNPFQQPAPTTTTPPPQNPPPVQNPPSELRPQAESAGIPALEPRISPQPVHLALSPGEEKLWNVVGMDLDGLTSSQLTLHYDPQALQVSDVAFGSALNVNPLAPPVVSINSKLGVITISSSDGKPLVFNSGGEIATLRVRGGATGQTNLVVEVPELKNGQGALVASEISGGLAKVE
ncbi:MAG TPA: secretin N-terminal domain-containing protein [Thermoanaerobaculia bacterium]|nr:secretin N-terminal domain-containing protein [Thermoanaerobaculia bacterium]